MDFARSTAELRDEPEEWRASARDGADQVPTDKTRLAFATIVWGLFPNITKLLNRALKMPLLGHELQNNSAESQYQRPKRNDQGLMTDSKMTLPDIFDWPARRSVNVIGISTMRRPARWVRKAAST